MDYTNTYIQRDVRQIINVGDLQTFSGFLKLCAGRTAWHTNIRNQVVKAPQLHFFDSGLQPSLFHYRKACGPEIDLLIEHGLELELVEIKSGAAINTDFFKNLKRFSDRMERTGKNRPLRRHVVYGGDDSQKRSDAQVLSWRHIQELS